MNNELIRLKEVSKIIGLKVSTLRKMIKRNELKGVLIGGNYYIRPNDYYEFIFNIECKKLGVNPDIMKKIMKEETKKQDEDLVRQLGLGKLGKESQQFIINALSYLK